MAKKKKPPPAPGYDSTPEPKPIQMPVGARSDGSLITSSPTLKYLVPPNVEKAAICEAPPLDAIPRIVVKFRDEIKLEYRDAAQTYLAKIGVTWDDITKVAGQAVLNTIYRSGRLGEKFNNLEKLTSVLINQALDQAKIQNSTYRPPNFWNYFVVEGLSPEVVEPVLKILRSWEKVIETAYLQPTAAEPANGVNPVSGFQGYLRDAPVGIGTRYAHQNGGAGHGQDFVDLERCWHFDHEDLVDGNGVRRSNLLSSPGSLVFGAISHGTNTLGVVSATDNNIGCVGIVPNLRTFDVISYGMSAVDIPAAIHVAAAHLNQRGPGGVLLLEVQALDANFNCWPIEIDDTVFNAIQLATQSGVVVIEPAGNGRLGGGGGQSLDTYPDPHGRNIFDRGFRDSGAILVGAGEIVGVGQNAGNAAAIAQNVAWQRAAMSNFGTFVDCFAWGYGVWTTDSSPGVPYTGAFGATSGASAIVAGAALALQGMAQRRGARLSPAEVRAALSDKTAGINTPTVSPGDLIGVMPDLEQLGIVRLGLPALAGGGAPGVPPGGPVPGGPPVPPPTPG